MDRVEPIESFTGQYSFLSNFYEGGGVEPTVEHWYQALKTADGNSALKILDAPTPGQAKKLGQRVKLIPDWENQKIGFMFHLLVEKFEDPDLRAKLIATAPAKLVEGNHWGDTYWGVCRGKGMNMLGHLLEVVRSHCEDEGS